MDFDQRLQHAIQRGQKARQNRDDEEVAKRLNEDELRSIHSAGRVELSEHIEQCLRKLADHFPGFRYQTLASDEGWGARISRDDLMLRGPVKPQSLYSRLEITVPRFNSAHIIEVVCKGTIRNRDLIHRKHFQRLPDANLAAIKDVIDLWSVEYAEQFAAAE